MGDGIHDNDLTQYFTYLINDAHLDNDALTIALEQRGECRRLAGRYYEALADYNRAIELDRESAAAGAEPLGLGGTADAEADSDGAGPSRLPGGLDDGR